MLAINGVPITELGKDDKLAEHIRTALIVIKKKRYWKLEFHESKIRASVPGSTSGRVETSAGILQKGTSKYVFQGMEHDITYFTSQAKLANGVTKFKPNYIDFAGPMPLDPKRSADLIFYMTCVRPACAEYTLLMKWQNRQPGADLFYKVEDILADASIKNVHSREIAKVNSYIFDEDFGLANDILINLAVGHGVPNANEINIELVRFNLSNSLLKQTNGKYDMVKINNFLDEVKDTSLARLRSNVLVAIEKRMIINTKTSTGKNAWYDTTAEGKKRSIITTFPVGNDPQTAIIRYLASKPKQRDEFEQFVQAGVIKPKAGITKHVIENIDEPIEGSE